MQEVGGSNPPGSTENRRSGPTYALCSHPDDPATAATGAAIPTIRLLQPLVQPHGPTVAPGTCSATGLRMFAKVRPARLAELQNCLSQTDPAGEWSFRPADLGPNTLEPAPLATWKRHR